MQEIPPGILPDRDQMLVLTIAIEHCGEFGQSYFATTPHEGEPEKRVGVEADLSGAAAKRRLVARLRRSGYSTPVEVMAGADLDQDPAYFLRRPQPECTVSREVEQAIQMSASILDDLYRPWYRSVETSLLEQGPNAPESDSSILAQLYVHHDEGMKTLDRDLHRNLRVLRRLKDGSEPFLGFEPFRIYCEKDQRQLVYDLSDLYWRREIMHRLDLYNF